MSEKILKKFRKSKQRQRTLEILQSTEMHPTATWLFDQLFLLRTIKGKPIHFTLTKEMAFSQIYRCCREQQDLVGTV